MTAYTNPRSRTLPESTYAVLGLIDERPASGYDLASFADRALGYFWPVSRTLAYRELSRLEGLGWLEATNVTQLRYPDKRVWSITEAGRRAVAGWLSTPPEGGSTFRSAFLLKFMFAIRMQPHDLSRLLTDYRESLDTTVRDLAAIIDLLEDRPEARMGRLAALHGLRSAEARLGWLAEVEQELDLGPPEPAEGRPDSGGDAAARDRTA